MKTRSLLLFLFLLGAAFFQSSCDLIDIFDLGDNDNPGDVVEDPAVAAVKSLILTTAENARGECDESDNLEPVRLALNELIDQLVALVPERTETEKLDQVTGSWRQVWSDNEVTNIPGICFEAEDIYQVISRDGYYYTISQVRAFGFDLTSYIRSKYQVEDEFLSTEVTKNFFATGSLAPGTNLQRQANRAENGQISRAVFVPPLPINGDTGRMGNLYVDDDLRIITDGRSAAESEAIFIMRRTEEVQ